MENIFQSESWRWWLLVLVIWDGVWRAWSLWRSARGGQRNWFIALFVVNSMGILPIVYLKFFSKKQKTKKG